MNRYDLQFGPELNQVQIVPHFCRCLGCYGTDPDHGMTFEAARDLLIGYYQDLIATIEANEEERWLENEQVFYPPEE